MVFPNSKIILESTVSLLHYLAFMNIKKNSKYPKKPLGQVQIISSN